METYRMRPRISVITLGVRDLERAMAFYRDGLGLPTEGIIGAEFHGDETHPSGAVALFELQQGVTLSLYPRTDLAKDADEAAVEEIHPTAPATFSIGHLVQTRAEVDALIAQAQAAGATVTGSPYDRPWGIYSGYFKDPDGHLWEIIWNPKMLPE